MPLPVVVITVLWMTGILVLAAVTTSATGPTACTSRRPRFLAGAWGDAGPVDAAGGGTEANALPRARFVGIREDDGTAACIVVEDDDITSLSRKREGRAAPRVLCEDRNEGLRDKVRVVKSRGACFV